LAYVVELDAFRGPLDLLLHLIQKNEVDIYDIPIARITDQYLAALKLMEALDIEVAGEFIVMAATLMEIKSRMLLPPAPKEDSEEEGPDPRAELVQMLEEYRRYQSAAELFRSRAEVWTRVVPRGGELPPEVAALVPDTELANLSVSTLVDALHQVLLEAEADHGVTAVQRERVTVRMQIAELWRRLNANPEGVSFRSLFTHPVTRVEVIAMFLAVLELLRLGRICVVQPHTFGDLRIQKVAAPTAPGDGGAAGTAVR
jgi:segregation and condensation protein A